MKKLPYKPEIIENQRFQDERGFFQEWFNKEQLLRIYGIDFNPRQANFSISKKNVIRGMHFGVGANFQAKLVMCASGSVNDVAVSILRSSSDFGQIYISPLSQQSCNSVLIPPGYAHGFEVLSDSATIIYLQTHEYSPNLEYTLNPFDPDLGIKWTSQTPILSQRDSNAMSFSEYLRQNPII